MSAKARILYAEDDETLGFVTEDNLIEQGYEVELCKDGKAAVKAFHEGDLDLCLLDVMMPEMDGFQVATKIREVNTEIPILFLTAKSMKEDRIEGLKIGGDDYITKPFSIEELVLRIEVFLKRKSVVRETIPPVEVGEYTFDHANLSIARQDAKKVLTQKEANLLRLLVEHKNNVVRREDILTKVWGKNDYFLGRSMDVFISRLRKYLRDDKSLVIENVHGIGFKLSDQATSDS